MKPSSCYIHCLFIFFICCWSFNPINAQKPKVDLAYQLHHQHNSIDVVLKVHPSKSDSMHFNYGNLAFGGQKDILKGISIQELSKGVRYTLDSAKQEFHFYFPRKNDFEIRYRITDTRTGFTTVSQLFRPVIMDDYFFSHGINLFLIPNDSVDENKIKVSIAWSTAPAFKVFYPFKPKATAAETVYTTQDSISYRFITGASDLAIINFNSESGNNYLVLRTDHIKPATQNEIVDFYLKINDAMREFWNDHRIIEYSLVLQPFINVNHLMSGISFGNGFIGKYNAPDSLALGERRAIIAHEIGHYYLSGSNMEVNDNNNNQGQWFNEGFNDYLTYYNLVRANNMEGTEFANVVNGILSNLDKSSAKNTANDKIFENFWKSKDYQKLPYWRGLNYAFYVDNAIAKTSNNTKSLRNLLLDLKQTVIANHSKAFTTEEFLSKLEQYLPNQPVRKDFERYIINGESILWNSSMLMDCFTMDNPGAAPTFKIQNDSQFQKHYHAK